MVLPRFMVKVNIHGDWNAIKDFNIYIFFNIDTAILDESVSLMTAPDIEQSLLIKILCFVLCFDFGAGLRSGTGLNRRIVELQISKCFQKY